MAKTTKIPTADKTTPSKASVGFTTDIKALEACIASDQAKLAKEYPKALAAVEKSLNTTKTAANKAKVTNQKNAKNKKSTTPPLDTRALSDEVKALEAAKKTIKLGYKHFTEQQKLQTKLEKAWAQHDKKTLKKPAKAAKKATKKATLTAPANDTVTESSSLPN